MVAPPAPLDIQLPTQPLDIASVRSMTTKMTASTVAMTSTASSPSTVSLLRGIRAKSGSVATTNNNKECNATKSKSPKKLFVRPFEDDYSNPAVVKEDYNNDLSIQDEVAGGQDLEHHQEPTATLAAILNNNNNIVPGKNTSKVCLLPNNEIVSKYIFFKCIIRNLRPRLSVKKSLKKVIKDVKRRKRNLCHEKS